MKRRGFLAAIAAAAVSTKIRIPTEGELNGAQAPLLISTNPMPDGWVARYDENPAKEPVTTCPNCGRFRTASSSRILVEEPHHGVGAIADGDYMFIPTTPSYIDGCLRCADED